MLAEIPFLREQQQEQDSAQSRVHYYGNIERAGLNIFSSSHDLMFSQTYNPEHNISLIWRFNRRGRLNQLQSMLKRDNTKTFHSIIHVCECNNLWDVALLTKSQEETSQEETLSKKVCSSWGLATGYYNPLPPEVYKVNLRLTTLEPHKQYQHLIYIGHNLAYELESALVQRTIKDPSFPENANTLYLSRIKNHHGVLTIIRYATELFPVIKKQQDGMKLLYTQYQKVKESNIHKNFKEQYFQSNQQINL